MSRWINHRGGQSQIISRQDFFLCALCALYLWFLSYISFKNTNLYKYIEYNQKQSAQDAHKGNSIRKDL